MLSAAVGAFVLAFWPFLAFFGSGLLGFWAFWGSSGATRFFSPRRTYKSALGAPRRRRLIYAGIAGSCIALEGVRENRIARVSDARQFPPVGGMSLSSDDDVYAMSLYRGTLA